MPFLKKLLYYGLLVALTLIAIEGMARLAYWLAFAEGYDIRRTATDSPSPPPELPPLDRIPGGDPRLPHPFHGHSHHDPDYTLNVAPPGAKREDVALIGLFGGSVAVSVAPAFQRALSRYFAANNLERRPVVLGLGLSATRQPQQAITAANTLLLGGHFDLIVSLDGFNEVYSPDYMYHHRGGHPFFPQWWDATLNLTTMEYRIVGRIGVLRQQQAELLRAASSPLRYTALYGIVHRYRWERTARRIIQLNHQLAATRTDYSLERRGPRESFPQEGDLNTAAARVWYRGSLLLRELAELTGAEYYHFLQPNQYIPGAKPLTPEELDCCYAEDTVWAKSYRGGYPELARFGEKLSGQQVNYFDLSYIFQRNDQTLYWDACCHFNDRGKELLAAAMVRRLEPALRRVGNARPPDSGLDTAARPTELLIDGYFQVYRPASNQLVYVRESCTPADTAATIFLHIIPADAADLPPERREYGFDNWDFRFADAGRLIAGRCTAGRQLPNYPVVAIRTGQYVKGVGKLWERKYRFAE